MKSDKVKGYKLVFGYLGHLIVIAGIMMLLPLIVIPFYPEEKKYFFDFFLPGIITIILGVLLSLLIIKKEQAKLQKNHDAVVVVVGWLLVFVVCTLPFLLKNDQKSTFTMAFFEVVSSLTTSGLTLFDVESMPRIYLIYRSILLFFGGMGIVIALISIFKESSGLALYNAEGHDSRIMSNIINTSRMIVAIYIISVILGTVSFVIFGMSFFDAIVHSISGVATAGFSTRKASLGYYDSIGIEVTAIILMLVGATSFMVHVFLAKRKFKQVFKYTEFKAMFIILFLVTSLVTLVAFLSDIDLTFRQVTFHSVSALTGTGFFITDLNNLYNLAPGFLMIMLLLVTFGGSTNSTSGGIKLMRVSIIFKNIIWQIRDSLNPTSNLKSVKYIYSLEGKTYLDDKKILKAHSFMFLYVTLICAITIIFTFEITGIRTLSTALFEAASVMGTAGFSLGIITYNSSNLILWTSIVGMFLGRLEIFIIFVCFVKITKDAKTTTKKTFN